MLLDRYKQLHSNLMGSWKDSITTFDKYNVNGRTFYPGDEPHWEAENLHYLGTLK